MLTVVELNTQRGEMLVSGDDNVGLTLAAAVGTRNDTRGPFIVDVPFIYNSSLRVSGLVYTSPLLSLG